MENAWKNGAKMSKLGSHLTDETKAKMSVAKMGNTNMLGHHHSDETKTKMSVAQMGRIQLPETRIKISVAQSNRSPETRAKMSAAQMGNTNGRGSWKGGPTVWRPKRAAKRRNLGFIPLNSYFVGCARHHLNKELVIHILDILHRSIYHNQYSGKGMVRINTLAVQWWISQIMRTGHTLPIGG